MTTKYPRLLTAAAVSLALAGSLAACGDDDTPTAHHGGGMMSSTPGSSTPGTTTASPAEVDAAFIRQMIPHHQLAVEMAKLAEQHAEHDELKQLAAGIIKAQEREIAEMQAIAKDLGTSSTAAAGSMHADAQTLGLSMNQMGMSMDTRSLERANPFDEAFIDEMVPHHVGAIAMAKAQLASGGSAKLKAISTAIVATQTQEIAQMQAWRRAWSGSAAATTPGHMMDGDEMGDHMN